MTRIGGLVVVGLVALPWPVLGATGTSDSLRVLVKGKTRRYSGRIVEETPTSVKIRRQTSSKTFGIDEIVPYSITYADMAQAMLQAFLDLKAGGNKLTAAAKGFDATIPAADSTKQPLLRQALEFGLVEATARMAYADPGAKDSKGKLLVDETIAMLDDFRRNHTKTRHQYPMSLWLGRMYTVNGDAKNAEKAFNMLATAPFKSYKLLADVQRAKIHLSTKQYDQALGILDKLVKVKPETPDETANVYEAMVLRCQCLQKKGQTVEAIKYLDQVIKGAGAENRPLRAMAHNTRADCQRAQGNPKDALLDYLRVAIVHVADAPNLKTEHARALYGIALCWDDLGESGKAVAVRKQLKLKYPRSEQARMLDASP